LSRKIPTQPRAAHGTALEYPQLFCFPVTAFSYTDQRPLLKKDTDMFIGIILVAMGALMILDKMGIIYGSFWDYLWPVALIALGVDFIFKHSGKRR
jgi:hypothetical protein